MKNLTTAHQPFEIRDCALAALATGKRAQNLKELRNILQTVETGSIYYHFWGGLLRPRFDDPEYNNDFSSWVRHSLHDKELAERLGMVSPIEYPDLDKLRHEIVEIIDEKLDMVDFYPWCGPDHQFHFITSYIVVFNTHKVIRKPEELVDAVSTMTPSSVYYHFIDSRRRTFGNIDDFRAWLFGFNNEYIDLCDLLSTVDPFFSTLTELRQQLAKLLKDYFEECDR